MPFEKTVEDWKMCNFKIRVEESEPEPQGVGWFWVDSVSDFLSDSGSPIKSRFASHS